MVRHKLWARYGRPMHFLSLEFEDDTLEQEFKKDYTRRNKRWVEYAVIARCFVSMTFVVCTMVTSLPRENWMYHVGHSALTGGLFALQYLQIALDRAFVYRQFQHVCFFWCMLHATVINIFTWFVAANVYTARCRRDAQFMETNSDVKERVVETVTQFVLVSLIMYRMPFLYFLYVNLYLAVSYYLFQLNQALLYGLRSPCAPVRLHMSQVALVSCGLAFLSFTMEVLQRKDFVQASMVFKESQRSDMLLYNIFPDVIVERLKDEGSKKAFAESHDGVTVLFADVVSFTNMSAQISPQVLVELLDSMFLKFDDLAVKNGAEKIKTIGDCYMAAAGLPLCSPDHAKTMARFGLQMLELVSSGQMRNPATYEPIRVRVGIHSGPCVAGVIGHKKFAYDIWGDTVNTASRMESHGDPMRLHCSSDTYDLIKDDFFCEAREMMQVKGKGSMQTYFVVKEKPAAIGKSFVASTLLTPRNSSATRAVMEMRGRDDPDTSSIISIPLSHGSHATFESQSGSLSSGSLSATGSTFGLAARQTMRSVASRVFREARQLSRSLSSLGFEQAESARTTRAAAKSAADRTSSVCPKAPLRVSQSSDVEMSYHSRSPS